MAESIAQQIRKILEKNPKISNKELYQKFPKTRPNTIRHYKSGFFRKKEDQTDRNGAQGKNGKNGKTTPISIAEKIASSAQKAAGRFQKSDLEKRVAALEKKVDQLTKALVQVDPTVPVKKIGPLTKSESLDKRIKELEQSLLSFINEKRAKIRADMSSLDELQQVMSKRITQFLSTLKNKG